MYTIKHNVTASVVIQCRIAGKVLVLYCRMVSMFDGGLHWSRAARGVGPLEWTGTTFWGWETHIY